METFESGHLFPKHAPFPNFPERSEILNEFLLFAFTVISASSQFIHLYRTTWWFQDSYTKATVNFYLIDFYLVVFIFVMVGRRFIYSLLLRIIEFSCPARHLPVVEKAVKYSYLGILEIIFLICNIQIFRKNNLVLICYLMYPIILYFSIFKCKIDPFLQFPTNRNDIGYLGGSEPLHSCTSNAQDVRKEVEFLKNDFNSRFKQIIFTSVLNSYYSSFVPCCFSNKHLFYERFWVTQHLVFTWISIFTMCVSYWMDVRYSDTLHRSAIHLGQWSRLAPRTGHPPPQPWLDSIVFTKGSYVKYSGEVFKSVSSCTSAIPTSSSHLRFYWLFRNPSILYLIIAGVQVFVVVSQLILISYTTQYQYVISIGLLLITNFHTLFKLTRDYLVSRSIYGSDSDKNKNN